MDRQSDRHKCFYVYSNKTKEKEGIETYIHWNPNQMQVKECNTFFTTIACG